MVFLLGLDFTTAEAVAAVAIKYCLQAIGKKQGSGLRLTLLINTLSPQVVFLKAKTNRGRPGLKKRDLFV